MATLAPSPLHDDRAFGRAYEEHFATVFRTARAVLGDPQAAEDVAHEVFIQLWRQPGSYDASRGALGPYLRLLARSRALDLWRREAAAAGARRRLDHEVAVMHPGQEGPSDAVDRVTAVPAVRAAVRRLPYAQREAIALAYWGGLSATEIADRCGLPLGTVKSRLRLGLSKLTRDRELPGGAQPA